MNYTFEMKAPKEKKGKSSTILRVVLTLKIDTQNDGQVLGVGNNHHSEPSSPKLSTQQQLFRYLGGRSPRWILAAQNCQIPHWTQTYHQFHRNLGGDQLHPEPHSLLRRPHLLQLPHQLRAHCYLTKLHPVGKEKMCHNNLINKDRFPVLHNFAGIENIMKLMPHQKWPYFEQWFFLQMKILIDVRKHKDTWRDWFLQEENSSWSFNCSFGPFAESEKQYH